MKNIQMTGAYWVGPKKTDPRIVGSNHYGVWRTNSENIEREDIDWQDITGSLVGEIVYVLADPKDRAGVGWCVTKTLDTQRFWKAEGIADFSKTPQWEEVPELPLELRDHDKPVDWAR